MKIDTSTFKKKHKLWGFSLVWFFTLWIVTGIELSDGRALFWIVAMCSTGFYLVIDYVITCADNGWDK